MNLPVSSTTDTFRRLVADIQIKFASTLNDYRDRVLNHRDARLAMERGEAFVPKHYPLIKTTNKQTHASNDRYAYSHKKSSRRSIK